MRSLIVTCLLVSAAAAQPAAPKSSAAAANAAEPNAVPLDLNRASFAQLRARLPGRLLEPVSKLRGFHKRFESVEALIEAFAGVRFGGVGPAELTDAEQSLLRRVFVVRP